MARFSIGIDLGTTNCAMASVRLEKPGAISEVFSIPQWESPGRSNEATTLPSFLYLPTDQEAQQFPANPDGRDPWIPGRLARKQAAETSGRVVHSAKSWLAHHTADRHAPFLPWRSDEISVDQRISPIHASALLLASLRAAWNAHHQSSGPGSTFDAQNITLTVPASFDAAAQRLTLDAAQLAGFPPGVRLIEEPQAAFYRWLEHHGPDEGLEKFLSGTDHVLVIDMGGGTTDLSLFEVRPSPGRPLPHIKRLAVSEHVLLGGDNIDLALAHQCEPRLISNGQELSPSQWGYLVARCRDLKERCLSSDESDDTAYTVSVPGRGSGLFAKTLTAQITRREVETLILDGFFPDCAATDQPDQDRAGLREWALPYATDSAVTRYLADFLRDRPRVGAVLFNGGSLHPERLRRRLREQIGRWQNGLEPVDLENPEPDLAVARGAAHFGALVDWQATRIEAGASRAVYLEVLQNDPAKTQPSLMCLLPQGAPTEQEFEVAPDGLTLRLNRPVQFQPFSATRDRKDPAGKLITPNNRDFHRLPPLQTVAKLDPTSAGVKSDQVSVKLTSQINELGLLQVACVSTDPGVTQTWPLEFSLRTNTTSASSPDHGDPGVDAEKLASARARLDEQFSRPLNPRDKISATHLFRDLEQLLDQPKARWNGALIRALWTTLADHFDHRSHSVEHEETWILLAGYLLRPGFGAPGDDQRIDQLWNLQTAGPAFASKRIRLQLQVLWRRVAGGLSAERQFALIAPDLPQLESKKNFSAEWVRLVGALERLPRETKSACIRRFLELATDAAENDLYSAPYFVALGLLLNRTPLHADAFDVVPASEVETAFSILRDFDWKDPKLSEIPTLFLRAARLVNDDSLDVSRSTRHAIAAKLDKADVPATKVARLKQFTPIESSEQAGLLGESLPAGLILSGRE